MRKALLFAAVSCAWFAARSFAESPAERKALPAASAEQAEFFESKVRPLLAENCFSCHSKKKSMGGLRLDTGNGVAKGTDTGPVVVPGSPDKSSLIQAINYVGDNKMPPKSKLPAEAVDVLTHWVKMGAPWPETKGTTDTSAEAWKSHWAFQPVRKPALPAVKDSVWAATPIDRFVLAKLEAKGLRPSPPADPRTLMRRATLDLTGLPPTPEEAAAFERDCAAKPQAAYEALVDRLLASPAYGERWGRHWLDIARYADTKGYVFREERQYPYSYTYRDYVIRSFNEDVPYNRFLIEQLAADRIAGADKRPLAAMGFLTLGRRFLNNQADIIDDRIDTVGRGLMGLTVSCARCHDHKFDPIPAADYYSLYGVFASSTEPKELPLIGVPERTPALVAFEKELAAREKKVTDYQQAQRAEHMSRFRTHVGDYLLAAREPGKVREVGPTAAGDPIGYVVVKWAAYLTANAKTHDPIFAPWNAFRAIPADKFAAEAPAAAAFAAGGDPKKPIHPLVAKAFAGAPPADIQEVAKRYTDLFAETEKLWVKAAAEGKTSLADADREGLRAVLYGPKSPLKLETAELDKLFNRTVRDKIGSLKNDVDKFAASNPAAPPRAMVLTDLPKPVEPRVFLRGNPANPGAQVPRQFLKVVAGDGRKPFADGSGRLEMAKAIASPDNPLTARVLVNRVWMHHFGAALVRTPSDFGLRSEPPSHPELLDFLAATFVENGWSLKKLHKSILMSAAYRQASAHRPDCARIDPENTLLWKMNRQRLEFEPLRDSLLAVSGALDAKMGGPGVDITAAPYPPRRSVYAFIERQNLPGLFRTFDFASPDISNPQRYATTVPQQALFLMNGPFVLEMARRLAARSETGGADPSARIERLYRLAYGRAPSSEELALGREFTAGEAGPAAAPEAVAWSYGYGEYDEAAKKLKAFTPLPHFTGTAWQGGPKLPDPKLGWVLLTDQGGHPGDAKHCAVRRWTAPADAAVSIAGTVTHAAKQGDGVRARIVSSRTGELGSWVAQAGKADAKVPAVEVKKGDTLDFIVDCRAGVDSDAFVWSPEIRAADGKAAWNAGGDFRGPVAAAAPLDRWTLYAQVLLLANEFAFVD